jgi:hypothetical protein
MPPDKNHQVTREWVQIHFIRLGEQAIVVTTKIDPMSGEPDPPPRSVLNQGVTPFRAVTSPVLIADTGISIRTPLRKWILASTGSAGAAFSADIDSCAGRYFTTFNSRGRKDIRSMGTGLRCFDSSRSQFVMEAKETPAA